VQVSPTSFNDMSMLQEKRGRESGMKGGGVRENKTATGKLERVVGFYRPEHSWFRKTRASMHQSMKGKSLGKKKDGGSV